MTLDLQFGLFTATGLTPGRLYFFKTTASNSIGESDFSTEDGFYAADAPSQPLPPSRGPLSTRTQIQIVWPVLSDDEIQITGYILEADLENCGDFEVIWNGSNRPEITSYTLTPVTTGRSYTFRYKALNYNGESPYSPTMTTWSCETPTAPSTPTWITSSASSI